MDEKELAALLEAISSPKPPSAYVERIVDVVAECEFRLANGGLTDVLIATDRSATIAALNEVGATRVANIIERAGPAFDASPLAPSGDAVATYQAELGETYGVTEVRACLKKWIASKRSLFALD